MRKLLMLGSVFALLAPGTSRAQLQLGARIGFAPAFGDAAKNEASGDSMKMRDGVASQIPLQLDASYQVKKELAAGLYVSYGLGRIGGAFEEACDEAASSCSASALRFGAQALYTLGSFAPLSPRFVGWAGAGVGYERSAFKGKAGGVEDATTASGFELNLQVGADYKLGERASAGPYLMLSLGEYTKVARERTGLGSRELDIGKTLHEWIGLGVAGKFNL